MPLPINQLDLARRRARVHAAKQPPDQKGPSRQPAGPANPQSDKASRGFFAWGCDRGCYRTLERSGGLATA